MSTTFLEKVLRKDITEEAEKFFSKAENTDPTKSFGYPRFAKTLLKGNFLYGFYLLGDSITESGRKTYKKYGSWIIIFTLLTTLISLPLALICAILFSLVFFAPVEIKNFIDEEIAIALTDVTKQHSYVTGLRYWVNNRYSLNLKNKHVKDLINYGVTKIDNNYFVIELIDYSLDDKGWVIKKASDHTASWYDWVNGYNKGKAVVAVGELPVTIKKSEEDNLFDIEKDPPFGVGFSTEGLE
jgi:hypothetical protein